jgi:citrate lyase subunit alpha / citrate CoA-transferase
MINAIGHELPEHVDGYGRVIPFAGAFAALPTMRRYAPPMKTVFYGTDFPTRRALAEPRWS